MIRPLPSLALLSTLAALACEPATEIVAPVADANFARSENAIVHRVSAGGQVDYSDQGFPGLVEKYGFTASVDGAGNVKGQLQADWDNGLKFHMEITCLSVDGNAAWLDGVITKTTGSGPFSVGSAWVWNVVDNGEGGNAVPDQLSFFTPSLGDACSTQPDLGAFAWTEGNVQVK